LLAVVFLTGCAHSAVGISNARPVAPSGNVNASGTVAAALLITTAAIAASQGGSNSAPSAPSSSMSWAWTSQPVPGMAPEREVGDQDCTKPIDLSAGNLRCR
jgi:hypothetical protein